MFFGPEQLACGTVVTLRSPPRLSRTVSRATAGLSNAASASPHSTCDGIREVRSCEATATIGRNFVPPRRMSLESFNEAALLIAHAKDQKAPAAKSAVVTNRQRSGLRIRQ
jgi:hypothetical protein